MMTRFFLFQDEKSHKYWEISLAETIQTVHFGRVGTRGQMNEKSFETAELCEKDALATIQEKLKKGYLETENSSRQPDEITLAEIGGVTPIIRFEEGLTYLIMEIPLFSDENGHQIDGDADFPEGDVFEEIISKYIGKTVERENREVFFMENASPAQVAKLKFFIENYWSLREETVKKYSLALFEKVVQARNRLNGK